MAVGQLRRISNMPHTIKCARCGQGVYLDKDDHIEKCCDDGSHITHKQWVDMFPPKDNQLSEAMQQVGITSDELEQVTELVETEDMRWDSEQKRYVIREK